MSNQVQSTTSCIPDNDAKPQPSRGPVLSPRTSKRCRCTSQQHLTRTCFHLLPPPSEAPFPLSPQPHFQHWPTQVKSSLSPSLLLEYALQSSKPQAFMTHLHLSFFAAFWLPLAVRTHSFSSRLTLGLNARHRSECTPSFVFPVPASPPRL